MKSADWMDSISAPTERLGLATRVSDIVLEWLDRARERRHLARLDDRTLADIGLSRAQAWSEQRKHFWEK